MRIPIPHTSAQAWESLRKTTQPKNIGLIFDRFVQQDWSRNAEKDIKKIALQEIVFFKDRDGTNIPHKVDELLLKAWIARWTEIAQKTNAGEIIKMKTDWRFVTGLGHKGPLETGFTFHRYGFPILPGSSVKGIARAYAMQALKLTEGNPIFQQLFGFASTSGEEKGASGIGNAIFFDAIPAHAPELKLDIINPHYPDYYQDTSGKTPPTNWQSPIPSYFLTVAPNQEFYFAVGWRGKISENAHKLAKECLIGGLQTFGAGAKTSAGYGYWHEVKPMDMP
ncbi:MAG: type III-B CRISPR module RAMP protein Cmr6 [Chloroflexi bacterium]|nr:type III-B CRISPR module RAMP protein Cmr6 [Chloroflexota bacterium]